MPDSAGVPEIAPEDDNESPEGRVPLFFVHDFTVFDAVSVVL